MTSLEAVRASLMETVDGLLTRPGMWASSGGEAETLTLHVLALLDLIDGRDGRPVTDERRRHGKLGFTGPFSALFGEGRHGYRAEAVSIAAQLFALQGVWQPRVVVPAEDWDALVGSLRDRFDERDARRSAVREAHGEPSHTVELGTSAIDAYMREGDPSAWVFFDFWREPFTGPYGEALPEPIPDPWLRDVRHPAPRWADGLVLTAFGKHLRWGPGWWMHHATRQDPERAEIAAQLREIDDDDPSQSLRHGG